MRGVGHAPARTGIAVAIAVITAMAASACGISSGGSVDLVLSLPATGDLRPTGMTTVGVTETQADGTTSVTTTPLSQGPDGMHFAAGDVPVGVPITLAAELRDQSSRLVGYGAVTAPITPSSSAAINVTIPVRKPIVFVTSDQPIATIDPTRDVGTAKYQGSLGASGVVVVPIDGTEVAVITSSGVQRYATATDMPVGSAIPTSAGTPLDAAPVPGQRRIVVGTASGIAVVDIDQGTATKIPTPEADRVAIGGSADTGFTAYVLNGRVGPPTGATASCSGASTVYAVSIDTAGATAMQLPAKGTPLADIAADGAAVFGADPCDGVVKRLDAGGALTLTLPGAAAVAIQDHRLWAAGSLPPVQPPDPKGARIELASIGVDGSGMRQIQLPPKSETVIYANDQAQELSIDLHADTEVPLDLVVLPTADQVALIARMDTHRDARGDSFGKVIPEMAATVYDVVLADTVSGAATRIRAMCDLMVIANADAEFPDWNCAAPNEAEAPAGGEYTPAAVDAVYGAR